MFYMHRFCSLDCIKVGLKISDLDVDVGVNEMLHTQNNCCAIAVHINMVY